MIKRSTNVRVFLKSSKELLEIPMSPMRSVYNGRFCGFEAYVEEPELIQSPHKKVTYDESEKLILKYGSPQQKREMLRRKNLNLKRIII